MKTSSSSSLSFSLHVCVGKSKKAEAQLSNVKVNTYTLQEVRPLSKQTDRINKHTESIRVYVEELDAQKQEGNSGAL